jgi:hypothetical protein
MIENNIYVQQKISKKKQERLGGASVVHSGLFCEESINCG